MYSTIRVCTHTHTHTRVLIVLVSYGRMEVPHSERSQQDLRVLPCLLHWVLGSQSHGVTKREAHTVSSPALETWHRDFAWEEKRRPWNTLYSLPKELPSFETEWGEVQASGPSHKQWKSWWWVPRGRLGDSLAIEVKLKTELFAGVNWGKKL